MLENSGFGNNIDKYLCSEMFLQDSLSLLLRLSLVLNCIVEKIMILSYNYSEI